MSNVLGTLAELVTEVGLDVVFELGILVQIDSVPELGLARMQVVNTVEVKILLVPAKHGLPRAYINVGRRDAFNVFTRLKSITKTEISC
jgi:hypothetical protein